MSAAGPRDDERDDLSPFTAAPPAARDRHAWTDAVWASVELKPLEKLVLLAYGKFAGNGTDGVWVTLQTLLEHTGLSRDAAVRALRGARSAGWLYQTEKSRQHRSSRFRLTFPSGTGDGPLEVIHNLESSGTADGPLDAQQSVSRHSAVRLPYPNPKEPDLTDEYSVSQSSPVTHAREASLPPVLADRARSLKVDPAAVVDAVRGRTGRTVTADRAVGLASEIIGRSPRPVRNGTAYVLRAITDHPDEVTGMLDAVVPPRVSDADWNAFLDSATPETQRKRGGRLTPMERAAQTAAAGRRFAAAGRTVGGQIVTTLELES